jgi:ParB family chromosome partitioning protein
MDRRLGKGLGTLLQTPTHDAGVAQIELNLISPNPFQPRKVMDPAGLEELRDSIREHGILQPIVVRRHGDEYQIVSGERRWRAARLAGLDRLPALVREQVTDHEMLELALVENVQRRDLNPLERAQAFKSLMEQLQLTQDAVAAKVGLKRSTVANHLRLLDLPAEVRDAVAKGLLSMGHARAFLGMADLTKMLALLEQTVRRDLSVRDVERIVRESSEPGRPGGSTSAAPSAPAWVAAVEHRLRDKLATKVSVTGSQNGRGSITIEFYNHSDLNRLLDQIAPPVVV